MLVTVVTPSYNQGHYIKQTIDSVLNQSYKNIELIVVDGGSTDDTIDILKSINDSRLIWISESDKGQSDAINKGLKLAKGEVLTYLNSDDLLLPDCIKTIADYMTANPDVDLVYGDMQILEADGSPASIAKGKPYHLRAAIVIGQPIIQQGGFWTKRLMDTIGLYDETLHYTMDADYWLRAAIAGARIEYLPGVRAAFRLHETSKSVSLQDGFTKDWEKIITQIYNSEYIPDEIRDMKQEAFAVVEWSYTKRAWQSRDYDTARPRLRQVITHGERIGRRGIASLMLIDSYLHTPLTKIADKLYRKFTGRQILYGRYRAI